MVVALMENVRETGELLDDENHGEMDQEVSSSPTVDEVFCNALVSQRSRFR